MTPKDKNSQPSNPPRPRQPAGEEATLLDAIRARPSRVIVPIAALCALALLVALLRPATYTAETRLTVGRIDVSTQAAPGVVSASQSLAGAYSRAISADQVGDRIERELGDIGTPADNLGASPVPDSPVIVVEAKASSAEDAIELANVGSQALIGYINDFNSNEGTSESLLGQYQDAQAKVVQLESSASGSVTAQAELRAAKLKATALEEAYRSTLDNDASGNDLQILTRATEAKSDRKSVFQLLLFAAIVAGAGIGVLLAYTEMRQGGAARGRDGTGPRGKRADRALGSS
jgi:capsular polysaccharide biosynthesis protein